MILLYAYLICPCELFAWMEAIFSRVKLVSVQTPECHWIFYWNDSIYETIWILRACLTNFYAHILKNEVPTHV